MGTKFPNSRCSVRGVYFALMIYGAAPSRASALCPCEESALGANRGSSAASEFLHWGCGWLRSTSAGEGF